MGDTVKKRLLAFGGNIPRELFAEFAPSFDVVAQITRTSMASIGLPAVADPEVRAAVDGIANSYRRWVLANDIDKGTLGVVRKTGHDLLLLDLVDERFSLAICGPTVFSLSGEMERAGIGAAGRKVVAPDSDAHKALWLAGMHRFLSEVDNDKVVVNRVYWAETFPDGAPVASAGWIKRNNAVLAGYYEALDRFWSLRTIDYPPGMIQADRVHRWGVAPYHFTESVYRHALAELARLAGLAPSS